MFALALTLLVVLAGLTGCSRSDGRAAAPDSGLDAGVVRTSAGVVRGLIAPGYRVFLGVPYGRPPVGALRWEPPQPALPWEGMRDATRAGPRCIQDTTRDPGSGDDSEDCLSVNVWSPESASGRAVMVWVHGGGFANGSGDLYDARWLATKGDIVVVTLNYRLGALGFLAHPSVGDGNYGLADQQAALRWVHDNIAGFGGDPAKVTIAGESAGAMSVCDHLVAPGSAGLFRAAIIQSGPCQAQADLAKARAVSLGYAQAVGCRDAATAAACLRGRPPNALQDSPWFFDIGADRLSGPVTGTSVLPVDPVAAINTPAMVRVPVLIGTNRDEFTLFAAAEYLRTQRLPSADEYPVELADTFGRDAAAVRAQYPLERYGGSVPLAYSAAVTDGVFACVADRMATDLAAAAPVYAYEFNDPNAPAPEPLRRVPFPVGASHSLELRYLFDVGSAPALNAAQQQLSDEMIGYWSRFVSTGAPEHPGAPAWPRFMPGPVGGSWLSLQPDGSRVITNFADEHHCEFWAGLNK